MKPRSETRAAIRKLDIANGDVMLVKRGSLSDAAFDYLAKHLGRTGRGQCVLIRVDNFDDVKTLNEDSMKQMGWERISNGKDEEGQVRWSA